VTWRCEIFVPQNGQATLPSMKSMRDAATRRFATSAFTTRSLGAMEQRPKGRTKVATETATLKVGDRAPDFELQAHDGRQISLTALRGKKVVLAFFAFAFTAT